MGDDPRDLWTPALMDVTHGRLMPWDMGRLTAGEYTAITDYIKRMNETHAK